MLPEFRRAVILNPVGPDSPFQETKNMNAIKFTHLLVAGLALSFAVTGCHPKKPVGVTDIPGRTSSRTNDLEGAGMIKPTDTTKGEPDAHPQFDPTKFDTYTRDAEMFKADTVHFAFDSSVVKSSEHSKIAAVADYLKGNPSSAVEIQGYCDERGTEEYNRSLGERRALGVREELIGLGVDPSRVVTVTFGKDHPIDPGHDEAAWSKNRRAEFVLLTPPK
jgi:peptidoglycan-associated lipoprotein